MTAFWSKSRGVAAEAAVQTAVSLFLAVVTIIIVQASTFRTTTADLSQQILLTLDVDGGALGLNRELTSSSSRSPFDWFFVDLGPRFCSGDTGGALCPPKAMHTDEAALADLLTKIASESPRLIVLDILVAPDGTKKGDLNRFLSAPPVPVLVAWAPEVSEIQGMPGGRSTLIARELGGVASEPRELSRSARYLPALKRLSGPSARLMTPDYDVLLPDGKVRRLPGIALGAALVAAAPVNSPWKLLDRFDEIFSTGVTPSEPVPRMLTTGYLGDYHRTERVFSFPTVVGDGPTANVDRSGGLAPFHTLAPAAGGYKLTGALKGSIVVVGDSRSSAGDRSWSAIGEISGAEVILNDIRQYFDAPPSPPLSLITTLAAEWPFLAVGFIALFVCQFALGWFWPHHIKHGSATLKDQSAMTLRSLAGLGIAFCLTGFLFMVVIWFRPFEFGYPPNFVAPFVAMLLEYVFEFFHHIVLILHQIFENIFIGKRDSSASATDGEPA